MSDITERYLEASRQHDAAYEAAVNVCQHIVLLSDILRRTPGKVQIVQIPNQLGIAAAEVDFDGSNWPTATAVNNALADYHAAVRAVKTAWINVQGHGQHQGLQPPPSDPWEAMRREFLRRASLPPR
jgi:hypothetical protein